jgi:hypothetical protein
MKQFTHSLLRILLVLALTVTGVQAGLPPGAKVEPAAANRDCAKPNTRAELNINNIRTQIWNDGTMWWDHVGTARYEIPKSSDPNAVRKNALFAGGIWITGLDPATSNIQVAAMTFGTGGQVTYWSGPIDTITGSTNKDRCAQWDYIWQIDKRTIQDFVLRFEAGNIRSRADVPEQILYWPGRRNRYLAARPEKPLTEADLNFQTARFVDKNRDGIYDPLAGDYPQLPGDKGRNAGDINSAADQSLFHVNNDQGNTKNLGNFQRADAIGMEIHTESFAYATADPRNDMTFYRNKLINKGSKVIDSCYFAQWVDADLGYAFDDYVGCDVARGLGICYNGDDNDETLQGYGSNPPSVAVDFFIGPQADELDGIDNDKDGIVDEENEKIIASNFIYYNSGGGINGDPTSARDYFNYCRGKWKAEAGSPWMTYDMRQGTTPEGQTINYQGRNIIARRTKFMFPDTSDQRICWGQEGNVSRPCPSPDPWGNSLPLPAWNERVAGNPPADRRFLTTAGPFTLVPGAVNDLTIGVVWARATSGGSVGSFRQLLINDDRAQRLFDNDFVGVNGPNEPIVDVVELNREVVLVIRPDSFLGTTTETYTVRDGSFTDTRYDSLYRFQGYIVYQLADPTVSTTELSNPDRARIVAQSDLQDTVSTIINEFDDPDLGGRSRQVMVRGNNRGIQRIIRINRDQFNDDREGLINFKKYYFRVIAYAYNNHPQNLGEDFLFSTPRRDPKTGGLITVVTGIPHNPAPEQGGTVIGGRVDLNLPLVRVTGSGNGGNELDSLSPSSEAAIVAQTLTNSEISYAGTSPVSVKVFNPKRLTNGSFKLEVSSRIRMRRTGSYLPAVGDKLQATLSTVIPPNAGEAAFSLSTSIAQSAGRAVVNRVLPTSTPDVYDLDVTMYNDDEGGRFTRVIEERKASNGSFIQYIETQETFSKEGDNSQVATAIEYVGADYWKLTNTTSNSITYSDFRISQAQEQLLPQYGIAINVTDKVNPGEFYEINPRLGLQSGTVLHADRRRTWVSQANALLSVDRGIKGGDRDAWLAVDKAANYFNVLNGSFMPYFAARPGNRPISPYDTVIGGALTLRTFGARYSSGSVDEDGIRSTLRNLHNVDVVLTADRTKWTRCVVLQGNPEGAANDNERLLKSTVPSITRDGTPSGENAPDGTPSTGMGWFPGYVVDLDRGIRLNLMFSEFRYDGSYASFTQGVNPGTQASGNDLQYTFSGFAGTFIRPSHHHLYVMNTPYDEARNYEREFDEIEAFPRFPINRFLGKVIGVHAQTMWVGDIQTVGDSLQTDARLQLRVDRRLESYPRRGGDTLTNPVYSFNSQGFATQRGVEAVAKSALDIIRAVPNPYYAYSQYESDKVDNRIYITNLPSKCTVSIYSLSGSLIRRFTRDVSNVANQNEQTYQEWDLKNQFGLPIASGTYLIHIDAGSLGEKTIKWFGAIRPIDLSGLSAN